jgi:hypothetical protein
VRSFPREPPELTDAFVAALFAILVELAAVRSAGEADESQGTTREQ